jgi:transcriptional regulator with XRE-family HTH domain
MKQPPITPTRCRQARNMLGLRQQDLADACGLCAMTISAYESGRKPLARSTRVAILDALMSAGAQFHDGYIFVPEGSEK